MYVTFAPLTCDGYYLQGMKTQVFIIHGGMTFKNKRDYLEYLKTRDVSIEKKARWNDVYLKKKLGDDFEVIRPEMPLAENANYEEWKTHFERHFPFLKHGIILVGCSLGGIFLAKYLSENKFPKKILSVYLVGSPFDHSLSTEDLVGGFRLKADLSFLEKQVKNLNLLFSKDDDVVLISHAEKFRRKLKKANIVVYESKNGHFKISEFPEIVKMIRADVRDRKKK